MCGIAGIVYSDPTRVAAESDVIRFRDTLLHRGPDDAGHFIAPGIVLATRRLAILDLSRNGHMPMATPDGRYWITYNGEIYNYREMRKELEARGVRFRSETDTEVLLQAFAHDGPPMLSRLNGMFAFAIWDSLERSLFLARDRLGIKPLAYAETEMGFVFASEEKALFQAGVKPAFDESSLEELLCFRFVAGEATPYSGVKHLLPGHFLELRDGRVAVRRWWNLAVRAREQNTEFHSSSPERWFRRQFDDAVALRQVVSDVPVGLMLSGGIDSSSIAMSLAAQGKGRLASFTVRFDDSGYDEGNLAREVARKAGMTFHQYTVEPYEIVDRLLRASRYMDAPLAHGNDIHMWALAEYAKPLVTVLLSGEGADESLGGYVRYLPLRAPGLLTLLRPLLARTGSLPISSRMTKLERFLELQQPNALLLFNSCNVLPDDLTEVGLQPKGDYPYRETVLEEARTLYPSDLARQAMYSDHHTFLASLLDRNDRMTMAASVECRVPFLDYRLVETLAAMPSRMILRGYRGKSLLRRAMGSQLPRSVTRHRKWGFGVPWRTHFRQLPELRQLLRDLPQMRPISGGRLDSSKVEKLVVRYLNGDFRHEALVYQLASLALWHEAVCS
jgi:asparagine synthase (glutamine-hydrolysing)